MKSKQVERRPFAASGKLFYEYLINHRVEGEPRTEVLYKLERATTGIIETRPATHAEKVRLHKYVNTEESLPTHPCTRMRELHNFLALAIYTQKERYPPGFNRIEWQANLDRAKDNVQKRNAASNNLGEITSAIIPRRRENSWRKLVCGTCRTPLLTGYVLDGQKITRRKKFCCDPCRMAKHRDTWGKTRRSINAGLVAFLMTWASASAQDPIDNLRSEVRDAFLLVREFEKEKPTNCKSGKLEKAIGLAQTVALYDGLRPKQESADAQLQIADIARKAGCLDIADKVYRDIISTFIGGGYVSHRQRAQIGIDDVREARRNKIESK